jgi:hypothetical protein
VPSAGATASWNGSDGLAIRVTAWPGESVSVEPYRQTGASAPSVRARTVNVARL